jgi:hypothetical protein
MEVVQVDARVAFPRSRTTRPVHVDRKAEARRIFEHVSKVAGYDTPEFVVRQSRYAKQSSGRNMGGWRIVVTLGSSEADWRSVIAHEVTHTICARKCRSLRHDARFYKEFFALIKKCGYDLQYSINREKGYKPRNSAKAARAAMKGR